MRIGIDIRTLMDKHYSGVSEYTLNLLRAIFEQDRMHQYKLFYNSYHDISDRIPKFDYPNVEIIKFSYPNKILNYLLFKIFKWPKIDKKIGGVDIMFMPHINFIALSKECKKIITIHDLSFLRYPYYFSIRHNFWQKNINTKKLLKKFNKIIAVSDNTKKDIENLCKTPPKKIKPIYSGIGEEYRKINFQDECLAAARKKYGLPKRFVLYLGNLEPRKNVEGIIEAYKAFRGQQHSDLVHFEGDSEIASNKISLVIAGNPGWGYRGIYELAKKSEYADDIIFTDYVNEKDKPCIYNLAEMFIYPSFYEGFGFPPLEAAACGTPCIVSNNSSLPEVMGRAAVLVDPYNISEMGQAIAQLENNPRLRMQLSKSGQEKASQYNWQKCAREVLDTFEEMV
ncbi:MAG: glycosyltransferase family 1 protein [Patescibacteria group bacterium]|jgi:glycosyltransferase involved in cell wall biosynthesis